MLTSLLADLKWNNFRSAATLNGALAAIVGPAIVAATEITAVAHDENFNPLTQSVSDLSLGPGGLIQTIGFCIFGILFTAFSLGLYHNLNRRIGLKTATGIGIYIGISFILLSVFHTTPPGSPLTVGYLVHMVSAVSIAITFIFACFLFLPSLKSSPGWQFSFRYTLTTGIIAIIIGIALLKPPTRWIELGVEEWVMMANAFIWMEVMGFKLLRVYRRRRAASGF
jgi:hypothetical protein